ncbi:dihydropteroate synthase [Dyadobacter psychrotolerans]|uniref:dihydropteroate synthase n=1 Tax=Dyadobacter psychrotolerans TaxID=2541721 RepID=A0A4R5DUI7_9BACT|nr:dihydropteroate synthase [Dyadobacter psychrotolerans]TDE17437.1 dihydropteroate synthase [Dyadobacter psychrotolerans]
MSQVNKKTINVRGELIDLSTPLVMGILNRTPDSFYAESRVTSLDAVIERVGIMQQEGASIIDIGGYSTRPGAEEISFAQEIERIESVIGPLRKNFPDLIISIDTFRSEVAKRAVEQGADIINDVAGGILDESMFDMVAMLGVPYILMHMRGTPETMNMLTEYNNVVVDVIKDLKSKIDLLRQKGVTDILLDPGFGFAKNIPQNFQLLANLSEFHQLGYPLLVGLSRKATIYKTLGINAGEALNGTSVLNTIALQNGASILRVHDVKPAAEAVKLWMATQPMEKKE